MKGITVLVTGVGAPGIQGTIYSLRNNYDNRDVTIVGTDVNNFVIGKYLCDKFYTIVSAKNKEEYINNLFDICKKERVSVILPQNTAELDVLSANKEKFLKIGIGIVVSNNQAIKSANNKYNLFKVAEELGISIAKYALVSSFVELKNEAIKLGWPNKKIVVKPPLSNGSRGVRIIVEDIDRKKLFYEEKPTSLYTTLDELYNILGDEFPELIVMEHLPGDEYTVDVYRKDEKFVAIPRKRLVIRSGITFAAAIEENESLINISKKLSDSLGLEYCFGFQFKENEYGVPMLLESNPRIQGTMVMSVFANANIIYSAVKSLLGEDFDDFVINWDTKLLRYWGAMKIQGNEWVKI